MPKSNNGSHWTERLIGGFVVAGAAYCLLSFWNTLDLGQGGRILVAIVLGLLFFIFGSNIWKWIGEIAWWS